MLIQNSGSLERSSIESDGFRHINITGFHSDAGTYFDSYIDTYTVANQVTGFLESEPVVKQLKKTEIDLKNEKNCNNVKNIDRKVGILSDFS